MIKIKMHSEYFDYDESTNKYIPTTDETTEITKDVYENIVSDEWNRFFNSPINGEYQRRYKNYTVAGFKVVKVITCKKYYKKHVLRFDFEWVD